MIRSLFIFLGTFVVGALIALVVRAAFFSPHTGHEGHPPAGGEYQAMVSNPLTGAPAGGDAANHAHASAPAASGDPHAQHAAAAAPAAKGEPVNTVCSICGMPVDPSLPTVEYEGQTIGFGCRMCPPKFKADPDRYGPIYLRNEVLKP